MLTWAAVAPHLLAVSVMAFASAVQAAVGVGLALLAVPLLVLVEPGMIPGPMLLAGCGVVAATAFRERGAIEVPALRAAILGLAAGTLAGAVLTHWVAGRNVDRIVGVGILMAVLLAASGVRVSATSRNLALGGFLSGVLGTLAGIHGPPISLVLQRTPPAIARPLLSTFFLVAYTLSVSALALFGLFGWDDVIRAAILLPGAALGVVVGVRMQDLVDLPRMRAAILAVAAVSAVILVLR